MADDSPYDVGSIVEDYIHEKLLKNGLKWESRAGFNDTSHPGNGPGDHTSSPPPSPSSSPSSSSSGSDSAGQRSRALPPPPPDAAQSPPAAPRSPAACRRRALRRVLREAGEDMERLYRRDFAEMAGQLHGAPGTARRRFTGVVDELFRDRVNWGRVVAFLEFGGTMCVESVRQEMPAQVDDIACWMRDSLNAPPLRPWIEENGGWDAFVEQDGARHRGSTLCHRSSLKTIFGLAALGAAGVTIGALFSQK